MPDPPRSSPSAPVLDPPVHDIPVEVLPGVVRLTAPNPSVMTGPGTNTYFVGHTDLVAIDPGPEDAAHLEAMATTAGGRLRAIVVTHTHLDHSPGSAALAARTGARQLGFGARDGFEPDETLGAGDVVEAGDIVLTAVHTPGHASNHLCYLADLPAGAGGAPTRVLFSGDHIMGGSTVVIGPPDGDMAAYLDSLEDLLVLDPSITVIAPGHGPLMAAPRQVIEGYLSHRRERETAIRDSLQRRGDAAIEEIVSDVYTDVPEALHPIARFSVWAHLRKLAADGEATTDDLDDVSARWRPA
ncbi:MAG: MBL fold metallo-hydrolase [Acidimicrobiales bacterium]|jgi:glyoxylase-like metal-dependent hydrolase (beta-lactamase superfamily II)